MLKQQFIFVSLNLCPCIEFFLFNVRIVAVILYTMDSPAVACVPAMLDLEGRPLQYVDHGWHIGGVVVHVDHTAHCAALDSLYPVDILFCIISKYGSQTVRAFSRFYR